MFDFIYTVLLIGSHPVGVVCLIVGVVYLMVGVVYHSQRDSSARAKERKRERNYKNHPHAYAVFVVYG